jgi:hypothetical protein
VRNARVHTHPHTPTRTNTYTHTRARAHTHTHTHTHTSPICTAKTLVHFLTEANHSPTSTLFTLVLIIILIHSHRRHCTSLPHGVASHDRRYKILSDIGREHPQALVMPLVVLSQSRRQHSSVAAHMISQMRRHSAELIDHACLVASELVRPPVAHSYTHTHTHTHTYTHTYARTHTSPPPPPPLSRARAHTHTHVTTTTATTIARARAHTHTHTHTHSHLHSHSTHTIFNRSEWRCCGTSAGTHLCQQLQLSSSISSTSTG